MAPAAPHVDDLPILPAPDIPGMAFKKDYLAACPAQHLAWMKCIKETHALQLTACREEHEKLAACVQAAKPAHLQEDRPAAAWTYWQQLKEDPTVLEVVDRLRGIAGKLGIGADSKPSSGS